MKWQRPLARGASWYHGAMTANEVRTQLEAAVDALPAGLRDHVYRVVEESRRLGQAHDVNEDRVLIAALGHDLYRSHVDAKLLAEAEVAGLEIASVERSQPILLHGPLGALAMANKFAVSDEDVLAAARHHTTARPGMSLLEKIIFVADKVEPQKASSVPAFVDAKAVADRDLDAAIRLILDHLIERALDRGWPLHPDTITARNELVV